MANAAFQEPKGNPALRWALIALAVVALLAIAVFLYRSLTEVKGIAVPAPSPTVVDMLPPPPPPPPPPPEPQVKPPEPSPSPDPTPAPTPQPQAPAPAAMTIAGPAQAGADSFGLQSGSGNGFGAPGGSGTCLGLKCGGGPGGAIGNGFYTRYLAGVLQDRVQQEGRVNRDVFTADFKIWVAGGRVTKAELVRSSGNDKRDAALIAAIEGASGLDQPPESFKFPQKITVRGRKSI